MWRTLNQQETEDFRLWAIEEFTRDPKVQINETWHPVIRAEILKQQLLIVYNQLKELGMHDE